MQHQNHPEEKYPKVNFLKHFPYHIFGEMRPNQAHTLKVLSSSTTSHIFEEPTGSGKTAEGYTFLKGIETYSDSPLFYLVPNKTHVDQFKAQFPEVKVAYGRAEYPCLYYGEEMKVTAQESPCYMLKCKHRVNQETGETEESGEIPCPYYQTKYEAKRGGLVVATAAFYLYSYFFAKEWQNKPAGVVIDEVHKMADILRHSLSFEISDYHLSRSVELLEPIDKNVSLQLEHFKKRMIYFVKKRSRPNLDLLLKEDEIGELIGILGEINSKELIKKVREQVKVDEVDRETLKRLQDITFGVGRYMRSLKYSIPAVARKPLAYTYGTVKGEMGENDKVKYKLCIRSYYVAGIINAMLAGSRTLSYSATIGNVDILKHETGIKGKFEALTSDFNPDNARIYLPSDVVDLSYNNSRKNDKTKTIRKIARSAKKFADLGLRSLVILVSNEERAKFMMMAGEEGLKAVTYDADNSARSIVAQFKNGYGDTLVGTGANFIEGVDLPDGIAPVTFILRPDYPSPTDPLTQFEEERHGNRRWAIWNWRVMLKALQGRGRNVRSCTDKGVTFFMSSQYSRFLWGSLPEWLRDSYRGKLTLDECIEDAKKLLLKK